MAKTTEEAQAIVTARMGPRPTVEPFIAGMFAGIGALAVTFLFRFLVIPDPDKTGFATIIVTVVAFAVVFAYFYYRHKEWGEAVAREFLND